MVGSEEIRNNIIVATRKLIAAKPSITIREIADACFVNVAAVNYYFGSKDRLLAIVLDEIIHEVKDAVLHKLGSIPNDLPIEATLERMIDLIYSYAIANSGILAYLFLNVENRDFASRLFVEAFFQEGDFKRMVFEKLRESTGLVDEEALYARYILIFSSFVIPLLIQLLQKPENGTQIPDLKNEKFKVQYIQQLVKMVH
jgi:AcrR family transcriptional regulator